MLEPCIMDVKIGKRTWDPLASEEKRNAEEQKYLSCKKNLGLCIPGFQVHSISTGRLKKYDKDYGKNLNEKSFKDGKSIFLIVVLRLILIRLIFSFQHFEFSSTLILVYVVRC